MEDIIYMDMVLLLYLWLLVVMVAVSVLLLVVLFKFLRAVVRRLSSFFSGSAKVA